MRLGPLLRLCFPWRALQYILVTIPLPTVVIALSVVLMSQGWDVGVAFALLLLGYVAVALATAGVERRAVSLLGRPRVVDPHTRERDGGLVTRIRGRLLEPATAREAMHAVVRLPLAIVAGVVLMVGAAAPLMVSAPLLLGDGPLAMGPTTVTTMTQAWAAAGVGVLLLLVTGPSITALAVAHARLTRALLGPRGEELRQQVVNLTRSRLRLAQAFDAERRRIERDLHDGAQQQLVALAMVLDVARVELEGSADRSVADLLDRAHTQAVDTLRQLRELIQGLYPPALDEHGLSGALRALADRSHIPVHLSLDVPPNLDASLESATYFFISEALTNAVKHSGAGRVTVRLQMDGDALVVEVLDDGCGGADPDRGTGLIGLGDRLSVVGGELTLISPRGGPTRLRARIPHARQVRGS